MDPEPTRRELLKSAGAMATGAMATVAVTASGVPAVRASSDEWPMFGHDGANTGYNPGASGPTEDVGAAWRFQTGEAVTSSPAVVDGTVYVGSHDDNVYAIDADSGDEQWRFETGNDVRSSPAVVDGTVYVGSSDGVVYAIAADSGDEQWRFGTDEAVTSSPAVVDGVVYVGSQDGIVYAIDAAEGTESWRFDAGAPVESSPAVAPTGSGTTDSGDSNAENGDSNGRDLAVFVGSDDGIVHALAAGDGEKRWEFDTGSPVAGSPAVADGVVYVGSQSRNVYALAADDGEGLWRFDTGGAVTGSPAIADGVVYVGSRSTIVYALDADAGETLWEFETGQPVAGSPAVTDGTVYVGSSDAHVYGIDAAEGTELWAFDAGNRVRSSPAVVDVAAGDATSGTVYVGSRDRHIYALAEGVSLPTPAGGGDGGDGGTDAGPGGSSEGNSPTLIGLRILFLPALFLAGLATLVGGYLAAYRYGLIGGDTEERTPTGAFGPIDDEGGSGTLADRMSGDGAGTVDTGSDAEDGQDDEEGGEGIPVWDLVLDDVIDRAPETRKTATEDLLVTKYVDSETLSVPVVAYEIESYRSEPTAIRVTEPLEGDASGDSGDGESPHGLEGWRVEADQLAFERVIDPDETVRTLVARRDLTPERADELLDRPDVSLGN